MHATTTITHETPPSPDVLRWLRHPRTREQLEQVDSKLAGVDSKERFDLRSGAIRMFSMFVDDHPEELGRDPGQTWSQAAFDAWYEHLGYREGHVESARHPLLGTFHFDRVERSLLEWLRPAVDHRILDVGAGSGLLLSLVRDVYVKRGFDPLLVALEASAIQLGHLSRRMVQDPLSRVIGVLGNAEYLPFADGSFDLVLANQVLEHLRNPARALSEIFRVLSPSGQVLITARSKLGDDLWDLLLSPMSRALDAVLPGRARVAARTSPPPAIVAPGPEGGAALEKANGSSGAQASATPALDAHGTVSPPSALPSKVRTPDTNGGPQGGRARRSPAAPPPPYDVPYYPGELVHLVSAAGLEIVERRQAGLIPRSERLVGVPRSLVRPIVFTFDRADRRWARDLAPLTTHLLVRARRRSPR